MKRGESESGGNSSRGSCMADLEDEEEQVYCECPSALETIVRISRTSKNPNRAFWACARYKSKSQPGCGFFVWCDVQAMKFREQRLRIVIANLQSRVHELEEENDRLVKLLAGSRPASAAACDECANVSGNEIDMVKQRLSRVERQLRGAVINKYLLCYVKAV